MIQMKRLDRYERDAARATFLKSRRVNIRLSAADLMDIQARAYEEGVPYQTLIASVLHKYVAGRLQERRSRLTTGSTATRKRAAR
jgi:predicted DNA binding CopG/RHH family protein